MKKKSFLISLLLFTHFSIYGVSYKPTPETSYLNKTQQAFSRIAKQATPGVVFIKTQYKNHPNQPFTSRNSPFDFFGDDFFRRFFGEARPFHQQQPPSSQSGGGSGFIVSPDGFIVTNFHVVKDAHAIKAVLSNSREYEAVVIGMDPRTDLAVLKIEAEEELPFLRFGNSDELEVGEWVVAIGNPFALEATLTHGVVSAKGRQDLGISTLEDFIQTDAAINPGNSGGPLFNLDGEVVGINTAILTKSGGYIGIGFAVPSNLAKHVMDQIISSGVVKRAYLGVILQTIDQKLADAMNLSSTDGILVSEIVKDSPAEKAGLQEGDIIVSLNGKKVKNIKKFRNEIALMDPGSSVKLKLVRDNKTKKITIPLGILTESEVASTELYQKLGIEIEDLDKISPQTATQLGILNQSKGVVITKVKPGSPAALAKLQPYTLITGIVINHWNNQKKIVNVDELTTALKELKNKKHVVLIVRHQNFQKYCTLTL
jgi:serine protease Do